jgi:hypothetical protein
MWSRACTVRAMSDREHDDIDVGPGARSWWIGTASGGPLDGSEIKIEAAPFIPMRGLHINVCVGDDVETAEWHLYAYAQRFDPQRGAVGIFHHAGTIEGDPKEPGAPHSGDS